MFLAAAVLVPVAAPIDSALALGARPNHLKVAIIVGPVGSLTDDYRGLADRAVAVARRHSDQVMTVYSPDATWPKVRDALDGASIVVYLGHGNGWPSQYSTSLNPRSQDGLGLNPVAGAGDDAHQYFGEQYLATSVHLAPGAVVLLHHLCYASGAAEPGMAEPPLDVAVQRVDNFAAGWLAAGASAVVAEAYGGPAYYVDALFRDQGTVEGIWRAHPSFHDHVLASDSVRTTGARVMLDPDRQTTYFHRSLVITPGLRAADVLDGGAPDVSTAGEPTTEPSPGVSLIALGASRVDLGLAGPVVADAPTALALTFDATTAAVVPDGLTIGTRWDLLVPDGDSGSADALDVPPPSADPGALEIDFVRAEVPGTLVTTSPTEGTGRRRTVTVTLPGRPGLYRLVTTLHDADGVAYDAASQELVPSLIVQVTGRLWASYGTPDQVVVATDETLVLRVRLANSGSEPWGVRPTEDLVEMEPFRDANPPLLVARWVALDGAPSEGTIPVLAGGSVPAYVRPGEGAVLELAIDAPDPVGSYLLVLDVLLPDGRSLAASGVPPGFVRVSVGGPPPPAPVAPSAEPSRPLVP